MSNRVEGGGLRRRRDCRFRLGGAFRYDRGDRVAANLYPIDDAGGNGDVRAYLEQRRAGCVFDRRPDEVRNRELRGCDCGAHLKERPDFDDGRLSVSRVGAERVGPDEAFPP
jgi:hypothetical protein